MSGNPELAALIEGGTTGEAGAALENAALGGMSLDQLLPMMGQMKGIGQQREMQPPPAPRMKSAQQATVAEPIMSLFQMPDSEERKQRRFSLL